MRKGLVPKDDPQAGIIIPIARIGTVVTFKDGETLQAGSVKLTAHSTAGHTPGGTSWTWRSCENERCLNLVYADSLTAVSADGFLFTRSKEYPNVVADFERSFRFLDAAPCDILITPHPEFSNLLERLEQRRTNPNALIDPKGCRALAATSRRRLQTRLARERQP